jgi:molybdate transport system regulatory protein
VRISYKLWIDCNGRAFGDGPARLLTGVEQSGSLRKAAADLGMSYNKAWRILHAAEERLGFPLLERSVGGSLGGGSELTTAGLDLLSRFRGLSADAEHALTEAFERHFTGWENPGEGEQCDPSKKT